MKCTGIKIRNIWKIIKSDQRSGICFSNIRKLYNPIRNSKDRDRCFLLESIRLGRLHLREVQNTVATDAFMNSTGIKLVNKKGIKEAQTELSYDYIIARKNGNNKVRTTWQPVSGANGYQ